ncbi:MAG: nicotinate (nicotinamide) nucleotide adenylyltransferase [Pseudomonadota bacterium]
MKKRNSVTAVFGGSFDPPHAGHLQVMTAAMSLNRAQEIIVVPAARHPFGKAEASYGDRLEMCRRMVRVFPGGRAIVSDIEMRLSLSGRTLDTIEALMAELPERKLSLLIGADILQERDKWYRFDAIEKLVPLIVIGRNGGEGAGYYDVLPAVSELSSTEARERLKRGEDCSVIIPAPVLDYIKERGLYT